MNVMEKSLYQNKHNAVFLFFAIKIIFHPYYIVSIGKIDIIGMSESFVIIALAISIFILC